MTLLCQINVPTQVRIPFRMVDATDGTTPEPGLTPSAFLCGPTGDTYAAAAGGITEISNGDYVYSPTTADVNANGVVITRFTGTGAMEARGVPVQVVGFDPTQTLPTAAAVAAIPTNPVTGTVARDAGGTIAIDAAGVRAAVGLASANLDTQFTTVANLFPANFSTVNVSGGAVEAYLDTSDATKLDELHRIHALKSGEDLVVTPTSRVAGTINQTIATVGTTTTVSR